MTTVWKNVRGGVVDKTFDVSEELGEPALLMTVQPDWIKTPPQLGERQLRVLGLVTQEAECFGCGAPGKKQFLALEEGLNVLACPVCRQYLWFRKKVQP